MLTTSSQKKKPVIYAIWTFAAMLIIGLSAIPVSNAEDDRVEIKETKWEGGDSILVAKGKSSVRGGKIVVIDYETEEILGETKVDREGKWRIKVKRPETIPCAIVAQVDEYFDVKLVKEAPRCDLAQEDLEDWPRDGGEPPPSPAPALETTQAKWNSAGSELLIGGTSTLAGQTIVIGSAKTGGEIGTALAASDGSWLVHIINPMPVPCGVVASAAGLTSESAVANAPATCDGNTPPPEPVAVESITVSGAASIDEATSASYTATATFTDGTSQDVTMDAAWSVSDANLGEIDESGLFTASDVVGDQTAAILASYTFDGVTVNAEQMVAIADMPDEPVVTGSHAGRFSSYEGSGTCVRCHETETSDVHSSVHYQWKGDTRNTIGLGSEPAGKYGGINDFCIYPDINWIGKMTNLDGVEVDGGCAKCHVGLGEKPTPETSAGQLANIDCLLCHSQEYKRKVEMVDGQYKFVPAPEKMAVSVLQAAADITQPTKDNCLNCHTKSGGGDNYKRGDIEEAHRNPTKDFDVHMASKADGGAGLNCTDCHSSVAHRFEGRGTDLRPMDSFDELDCNKCHSTTPHDSGDINKHTARVNCTVCHIPAFAKVAPTDMERNWSLPGEVDQAKRLYDPHHIKVSNVMPEYMFYNGKSHFYKFGEAAVPGDSGRIAMSAPDGSIRDEGAKIHAFKHHLGTQPVDLDTDILLPLKIGIFFQTGDIDRAITVGAETIGWDVQNYGFADTERYMGLFHEVAPAEQALTCNSCHNGGDRLDFDALGYERKANYNGKPLCASCHGDKSDEWNASELFTRVHRKHVDDKNYDCASCHNFTAAN